METQEIPEAQEPQKTREPQKTQEPTEGSKTEGPKTEGPQKVKNSGVSRLVRRVRKPDGVNENKPKLSKLSPNTSQSK